MFARERERKREKERKQERERETERKRSHLAILFAINPPHCQRMEQHTTGSSIGTFGIGRRLKSRPSFLRCQDPQILIPNPDR